MFEGAADEGSAFNDRVATVLYPKVGNVIAAEKMIEEIGEGRHAKQMANAAYP